MYLLSFLICVTYLFRVELLHKEKTKHHFVGARIAEKFAKFNFNFRDKWFGADCCFLQGCSFLLIQLLLSNTFSRTLLRTGTAAGIATIFFAFLSSS